MFEYLENRKVYLVYIPLAVYWVALLIGTSLPAASVPGFALGDKLVHVIAYFILAILLSLTLLYQNKNQLLKKSFVLSAFIISSFYGILDEIHQSFIPGRSDDVLDWVADSIGALAGVLLIYFVLNIFGYFTSKVKEYES